jgi:hypothetical protein
MKRYTPPPPGPEAPTDAEVDNKVVEAALGKGQVPSQALAKVAVADGSQLMTATAASPKRSQESVIDEDYEFTTDLMVAARYMPQFRRAARALVRFREKLNEARQKVLQVLWLAYSWLLCAYAYAFALRLLEGRPRRPSFPLDAMPSCCRSTVDTVLRASMRVVWTGPVAVEGEPAEAWSLDSTRGGKRTSRSPTAPHGLTGRRH